MVTARHTLLTISLLLLLLCQTTTVCAADIKVFIHQDQLRLDQSFQLFFEAAGSVDDDPDFRPLELDFEILGRNLSSSTSFVNGSISSKKTWILTLMAKRAGVLTVPPISFGKDQSSALALTVGKADRVTDTGQNKEIYLEVEAEPKSVYVQQQFDYKIRIFRRLQLSDATLSEPDFSNVECIVEKRQQDRTYETIVDGRRYLVTELSYSVSPQQSGQLTIEPVIFSARLMQTSQSFFGNLSQAGPIRRVSSEQLQIAVKPVPEEFSGKNWLPAESLQIIENWSSEPLQLSVGEPATRTLLLSAQGTLGHLLPKISPEDIPDFKLYPDQAKIETDTEASPTNARRIEKVAFIPTKPGSYELPEIRLDWWNTKSDQQETFILPARKILVSAAPDTTTAAAIAPPQVQPEAVPQQSATGQSNSEEAAEKLQSATLWMLSCAFLAGGWLLTAFAWWRSTRARQQPQSEVPKTGLTQARKQFKAACNSNDPAAAAKTLLEWGRQNWPQNPPTNLAEIDKLCGDELTQELEDLNAALYSQQNINWTGEQLWQAFAKLTSPKANQKGQRAGLQGLYPD